MQESKKYVRGHTYRWNHDGVRDWVEELEKQKKEKKKKMN